jgi:GTP cyclohydrolase I
MGRTFTTCSTTPLHGRVRRDGHVKDIDFYSLCVLSRQIVNAVGGAKRACDVGPGDRLWTLDRGYMKETTVTEVKSRKTREVVEVRTTHGSFRLTPEHPVMTDSGWREAQHLASGAKVEWINPRSLCRRPHQPKPGYASGYVIGAIAADGSIQDGRRITLVVKSDEFAEKYRRMLAEAFPRDAHGRACPGSVESSRKEHRDVPCARYRGQSVRSSVAGSASRSRDHAARPRRSRFKVVTSSQEMMQGSWTATVMATDLPPDRGDSSSAPIGSS